MTQEDRAAVRVRGELAAYEVIRGQLWGRGGAKNGNLAILSGTGLRGKGIHGGANLLSTIQLAVRCLPPYYHSSLGSYQMVSGVWMLHFKVKEIADKLLFGNVWGIKSSCCCFLEQMTSNHLKSNDNFAEVKNQ